MRDILDQAIEAANDDSTSLTGLLRKMMTVGHQIGSDKLKQWARQELHGYGTPDELPHYRTGLPVGVILTFVATYGPPQTEELRVSKADFPADAGFRERVFQERLTHSAEELVQWAMNGPEQGDVGMVLPSPVINQIRRWGEEGKAPAMSYATLNMGRRVISPPTIQAVVDSVRTTALELCLEIDSELPPTGEAPTNGHHSEVLPDMPERVDNMTIQVVYQGATGNIFQAENMDIQVDQGDLDGLLSAARQLGLGEDAVTKLEEAVREDGNTFGDRARAWVAKVKEGSFKVTGEATSQVIAGQMLLGLNMFAGGLPVM